MKISISDIFNIVIGRTTNIVNRKLQREFKRANLAITHEQWTLLSALWNEDGQTQQSLSEKTFRDKTSVTRLINKLESRSLVVRVTDKYDQRTNLIYLTAQGKSLENTTTQILKQTYQKAIAGISEKDILICKDVLNRVFDNLKD
ncbi:MarR family winged helix-turn-helix transcriptional regulator [Albibacterium profundi]|uniref:MarR family transcriptional regulator n=1 Tax=Albibacterium profundi TaxID=3134906 RepID=A0ABV5CB40_9SPHI